MVQLYVNGTVIPCNYDSDCPLSAICYVPLASKIDDVKTTIQFSQCGCSIDTGHQGNYCNAPSANMIYRLIAIIMFILVCLYSIDSIIPDLRALLQKNKMKRWYGIGDDERVNTLIKCILVFVCTCLWKIANLLYIIDNDKWEIIPYDGFAKNKKKSIYLPFYYGALSIMAFIYTSAVLGIGIMWVEASIASRTLRYEASKRFRMFVIICNAVLCLTLIVLAVLYPFLSIVVVVPVGILLIGVFSFGACKLNKTMKGIQESNKRNRAMSEKRLESFQKVRKNIVFSAAWIVGSNLGILIFLAVCFIYYLNLRVYSQPIGAIYPGAVTMDISYAFFVSAMWGVIWYTRSHINEEYYEGTSAGAGGYEQGTQSSFKQDGAESMQLAAAPNSTTTIKQATNYS